MQKVLSKQSALADGISSTNSQHLENTGDGVCVCAIISCPHHSGHGISGGSIGCTFAISVLRSPLDFAVISADFSTG